MNVHTEQSGAVAIVRVADTRLMYPMLADFSAAVSSLVASGKHDILIDLTPVTYVDSATIGCLMDLYRQVRARGRPSEAVWRSEAGRDHADADGRTELHRNSR